MIVEYNKRQNIINLMRYRKNGVGKDEYLYKCVLCGARTNISGSISNQGKKLICNECAMSRFELLSQAFDWVLQND